MAVRKKLIHDANTRAKIQTSQLVNRLTDHILGKVDLKPSQVTAALGLLKKTIPDLSAVEMTAEVTERKVISAEPMDLDAWEQRYSHNLESSAGTTEKPH